MQDFGEAKSWFQDFGKRKLWIKDFGWLHDFGLVSQKPKLKILAKFKILDCKNAQFKILESQNPTFNTLADFKILVSQNDEFKISVSQNSELWM